MSYTQYEGCVENFLPSSRACKCISLAPLSSLDVTVAMLTCKNVGKKSFGNLILLFCKTFAIFCYFFRTPTWPSHHMSKNQIYDTTRSRNRPFATNDHVVQEGKLIIIPALGHQNKGKSSFTGSGLFVLMSQCGNINELALQHGGFCTM